MASCSVSLTGSCSGPGRRGPFANLPSAMLAVDARGFLRHSTPRSRSCAASAGAPTKRSRRTSPGYSWSATAPGSCASRVVRDTMDYRSLDARRVDSLEEVRLNRRLAPDIYLDATPLVQDRRYRCAIGGQGEIVDWLVCMRRLDRGRLLDARLSQWTVDRDSAAAGGAPARRLLSSGAPAGDRRRPRIRRAAADGRSRPTIASLALRAIAWRAASCTNGNGRSSRSVRRCSRTRARARLRRRGARRPAAGTRLPRRPAGHHRLPGVRSRSARPRSGRGTELPATWSARGSAMRDVGSRSLRGCLAQLGDSAPDALLAFYRSHRAATRAKLYVWRASEPDGRPAAGRGSTRPVATCAAR